MGLFPLRILSLAIPHPLGAHGSSSSARSGGRTCPQCGDFGWGVQVKFVCRKWPYRKYSQTFAALFVITAKHSWKRKPLSMPALLCPRGVEKTGSENSLEGILNSEWGNKNTLCAVCHEMRKMLCFPVLGQ